ncbi:hypothetical protein FB558_0654 [Pseudonocardia kunmingensis]|uniref:Uncharacterized protein n=1 Tax=Pseudonocardia kunmingensis TaxID=630975 RepID=A0A543DXB7_9PSEU|nr:hypothetical protein FB558_0654 [Pseudonocardia kunmingensis]
MTNGTFVGWVPTKVPLVGWGAWRADPIRERFDGPVGQ